MKVSSLLLVAFLLVFSACKNDVKPQVELQEEAASQTDPKEEKSKSAMVRTIKNLDTEYCMGRFEPRTHTDFAPIPIKYADREGMFLRKDVLLAFEQMYDDALKDGVKLQIRSATRNFTYQKGIWERKWTGASILSDGTNVAKDIADPKQKALKILEYSSMPGTSRHHWGTDIDLNAFNNDYFEKGEGKKLYDWMTSHASKYGFCQPYTAKGPERPHGYNEEKWHWTFMPIGVEITDFAEQHLKNHMISGFKGAETAEEIDVVGKYVLGISHSCR